MSLLRSPVLSGVLASSGGAVSITLGTLGLSSTAFTTGGATSVSITGKTAGSTVVATSSDGTTLSVTGTVLTGTFTAAGTPNISVVETLAGATNTPKTTVVGVTVTAAAASPFFGSASKTWGSASPYFGATS